MDDDDDVLNLLSRNTVTILAIAVGDETLRNTIITNFNQRNPGDPLDQTDTSKITKFRTLRSSLETEFLRDINPAAASPSNSSTANAESRNEAALLALIAVTELLANPSELTDFRNYLESMGVNPRLENLTDRTAQGLIYNPRLIDSHNLILRRTLAELIIEPFPGHTADTNVGSAATEAPLPPPPRSGTMSQEDMRNAHAQYSTSNGSSVAAAAPPQPNTTIINSLTTQSSSKNVGGGGLGSR